tara:strand:+ start:59 stop:445 length:387 start_codon:yes stop_codon:yes gene_type:complete
MRTFSTSFRKNLYAILLGPLSVIPATIIYALAFKVIVPSANNSNFELVPFVIVVALMVAYPVTLLLGLPVSFILQKTNRFSLINLLGATLSLILIYGFVSGAQLTEIMLAVYFSTFVVTGCYYLHRVG